MNKNWLYYLNEASTLLGSGMFILLTAICFVQVILRYFFNAAQDWPEEASRFLFIWLSYLGMAYAMYKDAHLKVDVIYLLLSKNATKVLNCICYIVSLGFMALIAWEGWRMLEIVIESEEVALTLPVPMWLIWFSIPFTFVLTGIHCAWHIYNILIGAESKD